MLNIGDGINLRADFELQSWITNFAGSYDVARSSRSTLGVLAGIRYFSMDTRLSLSSDGPLDLHTPLEEASSLWNGIVGVQGRLGLAERWYVPFHLDVGTGDSDITWQASGGVGYSFKWGSLALLYRCLDFDQGNEGAVQSMTMTGLEFGAVFRF